MNKMKNMNSEKNMAMGQQCLTDFGVLQLIEVFYAF